MTGGDPRLTLRVIGWQLAFAAGTGLMAALAAPRLLLLSGGQEEATALVLLVAVLTGGSLAAVHSWWLLGRHAYVLRALRLGSRSVEPFEMAALARQSWAMTVTWVALPVALLAVSVVFARPTTTDATTMATAALLSGTIVAAASLLLHVLLRAAFLDAIELADPAVMGELVEQSIRRGEARRGVARRLIAALVTPVAFVALGSALIVGAHARRADERQREETARALARSALDTGPGVLASAGVEEAIAVARRGGFTAVVEPLAGEYGLVRLDAGAMELTVPLDAGRARVRFAGSHVPVLFPLVLVAVLVAAAAALGLGAVLGQTLSDDLQRAARGVHELAMGRADVRLADAARFRVVQALGEAIERLAARFRVFARAQRRAIRSREGATQMRGLFFASVSHDLKSPLNAILGFTELVRQEALTLGQEESLTQIEHSGRELLALIETVLDAARVEAGQLSLVREPVSITELFELATEVGRDLGGRRTIPIEISREPGTPTQVVVDRVRLGRALATLVGQGLRTTTGESVRLRCRRAGEDVELAVEFAGGPGSGAQLNAILASALGASPTEPRGLVLGLGLARSVVDLHGGSMHTTSHDPSLVRLVVRLPMPSDLA